MVHDVALGGPLWHIQSTCHNVHIIAAPCQLLHKALKACPVVPTLASTSKVSRVSLGSCQQTTHMQSDCSTHCGREHSQHRNGIMASSKGHCTIMRLWWTGCVSFASQTCSLLLGALWCSDCMQDCQIMHFEQIEGFAYCLQYLNLCGLAA